MIFLGSISCSTVYEIYLEAQDGRLEVYVSLVQGRIPKAKNQVTF